MLHHGNVMYVKKAFRGTDCARFVSFQKWKVWVKPRIVQSGLYAPSSSSGEKKTILVITKYSESYVGLCTFDILERFEAFGNRQDDKVAFIFCIRDEH